MSNEDQIQGWRDHEKFPNLKRKLEDEISHVKFLLERIKEGGRDGSAIKTEAERLAKESFEKTMPTMTELRRMQRLYDSYLDGIGIIFTNYGYALSQLSQYTNHGDMVKRFLNPED